MQVVQKPKVRPPRNPIMKFKLYTVKPHSPEDDAPPPPPVEEPPAKGKGAKPPPKGKAPPPPPEEEKPKLNPNYIEQVGFELVLGPFHMYGFACDFESQVGCINTYEYML